MLNNLDNSNSYRMNGAFKGRGRNYLSLLACPVDGAALIAQDGVVRCSADAGHVYPFVAGVLQLVSEPRRAEIEVISQAHDDYGDAQGWHSPDEGEFKSLPQTALPGYPDSYWPAQAESTALLWRFLEAVRKANGGLPVGPVGEAAVIGAGMGWLAYGLDVAGYATLAIDPRAGSRHGLGVYPIARYFRVQADLQQLPLAPGAFDWLVFQEGLCAVVEGDAPEDAAQHARFEEALRALRPGGWLAVMNSLDPSEEDAAYVHTRFEAAGLELMATPELESGWRSRLLELRDRLRGRESGVPPVLVAQKPE
ncbi:MAG: methyltransferase domain-containing protein [Anaerolineae bacterium]|nr:methyltransferase domain-containing protein [Anaerolineae bacterium]